MDRIQGMKVFVQVAQHASFATAARNVGISPAGVSKHVSALEARIGARLFDRTTRRVGLTEAGGVYLERCLECLQALEDADASVDELAKAPTGQLRVTAPIDFGEHLLPVVAQLLNAHSSMTVDLRLTNHVVDMVEDGVDVGVRVAGALDGNYVARPLARTRLVMAASPEYLRKFGSPREPQDLPAHRSLVFTEPKPRNELVFSRGRREVRVKLNAVMTANHGAALKMALHHHVGLAMGPSFMLGRDIAAGTAVPVLTDWSLPELRVFVVYPHRRFLSPKVRVFVEALQAAFGDGTRDPWWPGARAPDASKRGRGRSAKRPAAV